MMRDEIESKGTFPGIVWVLVVALLPLVVLALFYLTVRVQEANRYAPEYFAPVYQERYYAPGPAALALEQALRTGDMDLVVELQGRRQPVPVETGKIIFVMLWERQDPFLAYLYLDMDTLHRYTYYFEEVDGRWVFTTADGHYYLRSGRWASVFFPLAITWWLAGGLGLLVVWVYRLLARVRELQWRGG